jgi:mRNA-degrading endonuclease YafQ of YafQ-DinJ toxin-antitoxin module
MEVSFSNTFKKAFNKRIKSTDTEPVFWIKLSLFTIDPFDARLKAHKLSGKLKGLWSFSIDYDIRIVFYFTPEKPKKAVFIDIGNHDEVC